MVKEVKKVRKIKTGNESVMQRPILGGTASGQEALLRIVRIGLPSGGREPYQEQHEWSSFKVVSQGTETQQTPSIAGLSKRRNQADSFLIHVEIICKLV